VNGWPASRSDHWPYTDHLTARLPSTNTPSPDGKRYFDQTFDIIEELLLPRGAGKKRITMS